MMTEGEVVRVQFLISYLKILLDSSIRVKENLAALTGEAQNMYADVENDTIQWAKAEIKKLLSAE